VATAYTPHERSCRPYADGFTSTNYKAGYKSIAIDPEYGVFRYGDVLYIEGYGIGLANDCGSAIKGNRIDVCFNLGDEQKALDWGKKKVRVWILNRVGAQGLTPKEGEDEICLQESIKWSTQNYCFFLGRLVYL